jgi:hypothetical protein
MLTMGASDRKTRTKSKANLSFLGMLIKLAVAVVEAGRRGRVDARDLGERGARDVQPLSGSGHGLGQEFERLVIRAAF